MAKQVTEAVDEGVTESTTLTEEGDNVAPENKDTVLTEDKDGDESQQDAPKEQDQEDAKDDKPDDEDKGAPEEYEEFSLPEEVSVNEELMGEFKGLAKELNLTQADAQKFVDLQVAEMQRQADASQKYWEEKHTEWTSSAKKDKEYGGTSFDENVGIAKKALDHFGTPELKEALNFTGVGNHPEIIRFFYRVGKQMQDADMLVGTSTQKDSRSPAEKLYPTMNK